MNAVQRSGWELDTPFRRLQHWVAQTGHQLMSDADAVVSAHLSRYDALLRISKTLAGHKTIGELFEVLADQLHAMVPFDYLALLLHEEPTGRHAARRAGAGRHDAAVHVAPIAEHGPGGHGLGNAAGSRHCHPGRRPAAAWSLVPPQPGTEDDVLAAADDGAPAGRRSGFRQPFPVPYTEDIAAFMEQIAAGVAIAVENGINREQAEHYERELREERDRLRFLLDVNNLLVSHLDYPALLEAICEAVQRVVEADHIGVALYEPESGQLRLDLIYDKARGFTSPGITFRWTNQPPA